MKIAGRQIKFNIYIFFIVISAIWGFTMSVMVPMGQTPDEYSHFSFMLEDFGTNKLYPEDRKEFYEAASLLDVAQHRAPFDTKSYLENGMKHYSYGLFDLKVRISPGIIKFLPAAIGFHIGVLLHLPMLICHQLSELMSLVFYIFICTLALKKMPYRKEILMFVMLMPMAIQQAGSINPDVMVNSSAFLMTAMIFDLKTREEKAGWKEVIILFLLSVVILICKMVYLPIAFMILTVPADHFRLPIGRRFELQNFLKKYKIPVILSSVILAAGALLLARENRFVKMLFAVMLHPLRFLIIVKNTIGKLRDFYLQTMVGCFGWLDTFVSYTFIVVFMVVLLYALLFASGEDIEKEKTFTVKNRLYCIALSLIIFALIMCSMTIWTYQITGFDMNLNLDLYERYLYEIGIIEGVQGRYFIPFLPMLLIALCKGNEFKSRKVYRGVQIVFYLISMIYTLGLIRIRYWG